MEERLVYFRPRAILIVLGIILSAAALLTFLYLAWHVITWILIALFLALALNPAVEFFERHGLKRGWASFVVFFLALGAFAALGALVIPPLIDQIETFIGDVPDLIDDLIAGRGSLGFLQEDYQLVDRVREAIEDQGAGGVLGITTAGIALARGIVSFIVGVVAISFLTFFMLLEGPRLAARFRDFLPEGLRPRWERVSGDIYRTVGGYVTGNLVISLIAGIASAVVLVLLGIAAVRPGAAEPRVPIAEIKLVAEASAPPSEVAAAARNGQSGRNGSRGGAGCATAAGLLGRKFANVTADALVTLDLR